MLDGKESLAWALGHATNRKRVADFKALAAEGLVAVQQGDQVPECIVGSDWPLNVPGLVRATCTECGVYVGLSPDSGADFARKFPDVPIMCYPCAAKDARSAQ